jgi:hypothetical protein
MRTSKPPRHRGRPPKYVLDNRGREIVGLSYNPTNGMFYVTRSNPRFYFKTGGRSGGSTKKENYAFRRDSAIQQFNQWKIINQLSPEKQEEQKLKNTILKKATELIKDGFIDEYIYERAYDLINDNPVKASVKLGIKNLIFLYDKNFSYPFTLDLVWELFQFHRYAKDTKKFKQYERAWIKFRKDIKVSTLGGITQERMNKWKKKLYQEYIDDNLIIELFESLDVIFTNVIQRNYQSESIRETVKLINDLYNQVS